MYNPPQILHLEDDKVEITIDRLILRPATSQDAESLFEAFSDAEVMRYW
jgi:RimJ/RimL family protein N-acetyltransferase